LGNSGWGRRSFCLSCGAALRRSGRCWGGICGMLGLRRRELRRRLRGAGFLHRLGARTWVWRLWPVCFGGCAGNCEVVPKMGQEGYFGVSRESSCMDGRVPGEHASCYGVNLAFAAFEVLFFFPQALKLSPFKTAAGDSRRRRPGRVSRRLPQCIFTLPSA
jgi:hypothetical protein